ncbi:MAG TPA: glycosyltransferase family 2 protein [Hyphomicrobiaceae bacterium]|nr:glycosyltransferase family 2 protein [Hyphomicrobiaceae bacterium]
MSLAQHITALVLTCNEEANIGRTLAALHWVPHILVVDSGSTDGTLAIVDRFPQTKAVTRSFDSFAAQCNFGLAQIASPWVLSLDADYVVSDALAREILALSPDEATCAFRVSFVYRIHGRNLRAALYPPRSVLYRRDRATYRDIGHGHRVEIAGPIRELAAPIYHDDRKPLSRWLATQRSYARREADYLLATPRAHLRRSDRIRRMGWPAPILVFLYTLIVKRCLFDGWAGWLYVLQRTVAEMLIALELAERRLGAGNP